MKITVKDIFKYDKYSKMELIAGNRGLEKEIKVVSLFDSPDFHQALTGGEFLISTGYIVKDNPLILKDFISKMSEKGAAALGVKLRYIKEMPSEVIKTADELNFPLMIIPEKMVFTDINSLILDLLDRQSRIIQLTNKIYKAFESILTDGGDIQGVIDKVYEFIKIDIAFYHTTYNYIYLSKIYKWRGKSNEFKSNIDNYDLDKIRDKYKSFPVRVDGKTYGYLIIFIHVVEEVDDLLKIVLDHAQVIINIILQKQISTHQIERKYRDEFIYDLVNDNFNSLQEIIDKGKIYGWQLDKQYIAVFAEFACKESNSCQKDDLMKIDALRSRILLKVKEIVKDQFDFIYATFGSRILFIVEIKNAEYLKKLNNTIINCKDFITQSEKDIGIKVGIGLMKEDIKDIYLSYQEAIKALNFSKSNQSEDDIVFYKDMGVYKLMDEIGNNRAKNNFCLEYVGKLIDYDKNNQTNYYETLEVLERNNWNYSEAAAELYIHYNTVKYRFQKMCQILGRDLNKSEEKLAIALAIRINRVG